MNSLLFICTGNYYRSRYAEALFNHQKGIPLSHWRAFSRGLMIECAPQSISPHTRNAIQSKGITDDCYESLPTALTLADLKRADLVVALKREEHHAMMQHQFPEWVERIRYWDVHDLDVWSPAQTLPAIETRVQSLIAELSTSSKK